MKQKLKANIKALTYLTLLATGITTLFSCSNSDNGNTTTIISVDISEAKKISFEDILGSKTISIEMEENENYQSRILKIIEKNGYIICNNEKVTQYDSSGKFLRRISEKGSANNEYNLLYNCWVIDNNIVIYDNGAKKLLNYSLDGEYIKTTYLSEKTKIFDNLIPFRNGFVCKLYSDGIDNSDLAYLDINYNFVKSIGEFKPEYGVLMGDYFSTYGNSVNYIKFGGNIIYSIKEDLSISEKYCFDFGSRNIPKEVQEEDGMAFLTYMKDNGSLSIHNAIYESDKKLIFRVYGYDIPTYICNYDKISKQINIFEIDNISENGMYKILAIAYHSDDQIIVMLESENMEKTIHFIKI